MNNLPEAFKDVMTPEDLGRLTESDRAAIVPAKESSVWVKYSMMIMGAGGSMKQYWYMMAVTLVFLVPIVVFVKLAISSIIDIVLAFVIIGILLVSYLAILFFMRMTWMATIGYKYDWIARNYYKVSDSIETRGNVADHN